MKKTALLALIAVAVSSPSLAKSHDHHHHHRYRETSLHHHYRADREIFRDHHIDRDASRRHQRVYADKPAASHAHITCEMVRAYVAQVGLVQARALAVSAGMTASEERRAKRCLDSGA